MKLSEMTLGAVARVTSFDAGSAQLEAKLREVGFAEGDEVEMLAQGPFRKRTIAVRLNRSIVALRGLEAAMIQVEPL
jgi:ferrous iron transport protein A